MVAGELPAGKYHILACRRHLHDRAREGDPSFPYRFVWEAVDGRGRALPSAQRFLQFARQCRHYKGKRWAGKRFDPSPSQIFRLGSLFGWRHVGTGRRRFTTAYNELPRKQGKSFEGAIVLVYVTFFEGEPGAEGYVIATKRKQANIVFGDARRLILRSRLSSPTLQAITVGAHSLFLERTASKVEPLGADSDSTDGLNPSCTIADELHAYKYRDLLDVMESGTGARADPMMFQITTAGTDPDSPCGQQHAYACQILEGVIDDASTRAFFAFIAHADPTDDWQSETAWRKANPHYGISVNPEEIQKLALKAAQIPSAAAEFQQKILNWWVATLQPCLSLNGWHRGQHEWTLDELEHQPCYVGIDLASLLDLCALALVFPPTAARPAWRIALELLTPAATIADRSHRDRAPYAQWVDAGWIRTTPGERIDHQVLRPILRAARDRFDIQTIGFDPWHADTLIHQLTKEDGFPEAQVLAIPQTFAGMSRACLRMQADIVAGLVDARRDPVMAWAVSNVVPNKDGKDNLMFAKGKSRGRIDPVIAATIGIALYLKHPPAPKPKYQIFVFGGTPDGSSAHV